VNLALLGWCLQDKLLEQSSFPSGSMVQTDIIGNSIPEEIVTLEMWEFLFRWTLSFGYVVLPFRKQIILF